MRSAIGSVLLIAFLSTLFLIQSACAYDNIEYGFSITPPPIWSVVEDTGVETVVIGFVAPDSNHASISVAVIEVSVPLSKISESMKDALSSSYDDFNLVYETRRFVGGLECYEIEYTLTLSGNYTKIKLVVFAENGKEFVITYRALESEYSNYLSDAEISIDSFRVAGSQTTIPYTSFVTILAVFVVTAVVVIALVVVFIKQKKWK